MSHHHVLGPQFVVAGAPKAGTTALHAYLRQQPGVFVPELKEPNFFSPDVPTRRRLSPDEYLALFDHPVARRPGIRRGEVSVWYLYSRRAARAIHECCGPIPIVALLRNPLEAIPALHAQFVFNGDEPLGLAAALDAESERLASRGRPPGSWVGPECLAYRQVYRYAEQLNRFEQVFGRDRVCWLLFDDFVTDTAGTLAELLAFLGVEEPVADLDHRPHNPHRQPRNRWLRRLFRRHEGALRGLSRRLVPWPGVRRRLGWRLKALLARATGRLGPRPELPPALWQRLAEAMEGEVRSLESILGRDLGHWLVEPSKRLERDIIGPRAGTPPGPMGEPR